jgi:very-short-patch-repair endonuclease/DNA-directed RNA polymerase subunit RPC12/RpoP
MCANRKPLSLFLKQARAKYGDRYDYSKTEYLGADKKVCIICPEHGEFWILPYGHLKGGGCPKCSFTRTTEEFIIKAKKIFGDKYDYSKSIFVNAHSKLIIICPEHGEFLTSPNNHLRGHGCPKCAKNRPYTTESFIEAAKKAQGDFYDYSESVYVNAKTKVRIICPKHGPFYQLPSNHLKGIRCPKCGHSIGAQKKTNNTDDFIRRARAIHGDKYDFTSANYITAVDKVLVICKEHGEFWMTPQNILAGHGCPKCARNIPLSTEDFVKRSNDIHDGIYDYSKTEYINNSEKVCIICHQKDRLGKEHGEFWQNPASHMKGVGCPKCKSSHLEKQLRRFLGNNEIRFEEQKTFDWLTDKSNMYLDFFIPDYGVAVECQGIQHFVPYEVWGGEESLKEIQRRDNLKKMLCNEHGIEILYFSNLKMNFPYPVLKDLGQLLAAIKERGKVDPNQWKDPELPFNWDCADNQDKY